MIAMSQESSSVGSPTSSRSQTLLDSAMILASAALGARAEAAAAAVPAATVPATKLRRETVFSDMLILLLDPPDPSGGDV